MNPKIADTTYVEDYKLWLQFSDGKAGVIDLSDELWGPMFEPLQNLNTFQQARVDPELDTLCWPNGADFSPEFLYENVAVEHIVGDERVDRSFISASPPRD